MSLKETLTDAAYVSIGLGVLGFQRAQVRRQELKQQLRSQRSTIESQLSEGRRSVAALAQQVEGVVAPVRVLLETQLDAVEANLPAPAQDLVKQARATWRSSEQAVRTRFGFDGAAA